jgi:hypothetical protein
VIRDRIRHREHVKARAACAHAEFDIFKGEKEAFVQKPNLFKHRPPNQDNAPADGIDILDRSRRQLRNRLACCDVAHSAGRDREPNAR